MSGRKQREAAKTYPYTLLATREPGEEMVVWMSDNNALVEVEALRKRLPPGSEIMLLHANCVARWAPEANPKI
jgi:hypothetical protein